MSQTLMGTRIGTRGKGELGDDRGRWDVMSRELQ